MNTPNYTLNLKKSLKLLLIFIPLVPLVGGVVLYGYLSEIGGERFFKYFYTDHYLIALTFVATFISFLTLYYLLAIYPILMRYVLQPIGQMICLDKYRKHAVYLVFGLSVPINYILILIFKERALNNHLGNEILFVFLIVVFIMSCVQVILIGIIANRDVALKDNGWVFYFKGSMNFLRAEILSMRPNWYLKSSIIWITICTSVNFFSSVLIFISFETLLHEHDWKVYSLSFLMSLTIALSYASIIVDEFKKGLFGTSLTKLLFGPVLRIVSIKHSCREIRAFLLNT